MSWQKKYLKKVMELDLTMNLKVQCYLLEMKMSKGTF